MFEVCELHRPGSPFACSLGTALWGTLLEIPAAVSSFSHLCTFFKLGCVASVRHTDFLPVELHSGCKGKLPVRHFISVHLDYILEEEIIKPHTFACSHFSIASSSQ